MPLHPGASFGPFRIVEALGRGGMATVFKAFEPGLGRHVALKVLPTEFLHDDTFSERFKREARLIAQLEHPNIVPIHAFGIDEGVPWMAMRLVPGGTLSGLLRRRRLDSAETLAILRGVAAALDHAHARGVIHRDVKPQNILLDETGHAYLADFGIARLAGAAPALTRSGAVIGTPQYMAPEQASGEREPDHRCDIYALSVVAYEMVSGRVPFTGDTPVKVLMRHVLDPVPVPPASEAEPSLITPILKGLAKRPEDRWPTATALTDGVALALARTPAEAETLTLGHAPAGAPAAPKRAAAWAIPAGLALVAGGVAIGAVWLVARGRGQQSGEAARRSPVPPVLSAPPPTAPATLPPTPAATPLVVPTPRPSVGAIATPTPHPVVAGTPAPQTPRAGEIWKNPKDGLSYVFVPPGTFQMGCVPLDSQCAGPEKPRHTVRLGHGFWMGRTEVTVEAFSRFVAATGHVTAAERNGFSAAWAGAAFERKQGLTWRSPGFSQDARHPVLHVAWEDAAAFCAWTGGRLPTEAEWEYAARGGADGQVYTWGNEKTPTASARTQANVSDETARRKHPSWQRVFWGYDDSYAETSPVGSFPPNGFGLFDMAGNAAEPVADWFGESYYAVSPSSNPAGPPQGENRVVKGGSWGAGPLGLRTSVRAVVLEGRGNDYTGVRCVSDAPTDGAAAIDLLGKKCDAGDLKSCSSLGTRYQRGDGVAKDLPRAVELLTKACDGGDGLGCTVLGGIYRRGDGVAQDFARAVALFGKACNGRWPFGCTNLGHLYRLGDGVEKDPAKAVELYRQGCDGGDAYGCTSLGGSYERGEGVAMDLDKAVGLYRRGCRNGKGPGCEPLKRLGKAQP